MRRSGLRSRWRRSRQEWTMDWHLQLQPHQSIVGLRERIPIQTCPSCETERKCKEPSSATFWKGKYFRVEGHLPSFQLDDHDDSSNRTHDDNEGPKELDCSNPNVWPLMARNVNNFRSKHPSVSAFGTDIREGEHWQNCGYTDANTNTTVDLPVLTIDEFKIWVSKIRTLPPFRVCEKEELAAH